MQHLPFYSLEDFFCSKQEMEAFRKERNVARAEEDDEMEITAVKCPTCGAMLTDLRNHPCLEVR